MPVKVVSPNELDQLKVPELFDVNTCPDVVASDVGRVYVTLPSKESGDFNAT